MKWERVLLVVLAAVAVGFGLSRLTPSKKKQPAPTTPTPVASGRSPSFHIGLSVEEKLREAEACIMALTTARSEAIGAVRDDLALLADEEPVLERIFVAFDQRAHVTKFEAGAFADMAARIRDPRFVPLVAKLLDHEELIVRQSAIQAALVQRSPALTLPLLEAYRRLERELSGQGARTRIAILEAAYVCGGPSLPVLLSEALRDSRVEIRGQVARLIAGAEHRSLIPDLQAQLAKTTEPMEEIEIRSALFHLGERGFIEGILPKLEHPSSLVVIATIHACVSAALVEALPDLAKGEAAATEDTRPHFVWARIRLQDRVRIDEALAVARDEKATLKSRVSALRGLGAGVPVVTWPQVVDLVDLRIPEGAGSLALGISETDEVPSREAFRALASAPEMTDPTGVQALCSRLGDEGIRWILELWDEGARPDWVPEYLRWLGEIRTPAAREALLARRAADPALTDQILRIHDLRDRKRR